MPTTSPDASLKQLIGEPGARPWWRRPSTGLIATLAVACGAALWAWQARRDEQAVPHYLTEPVQRGDLRIDVTANGKLQPTRTVNLGSELSGTVARVLVDVNDTVKKGQVLVELDTAKLRDQITSARAAVAATQATVIQAEAGTREARAALHRLEEVQRLSDGKVPAAAEMDVARAALAKAQAAEASARANVTSAQATLRTHETNLTKASVVSPIDGVVLTRNVDPGYAVAASLQAVTLFTLAEDLRHLQISVNVDEADVGLVAIGQKATFTVSAWPGRSFPATVTRVAYGSTLTDNVVTYTTLMNVTNGDLSLRPGMTATATIAATERKGVLLVPNTALRFTPSDGAGPSAPGGGGKAGGGTGGGGIVSKLMPRPPSPSAPKRTGSTKGGPKQIWVLDRDQPRALVVQTGLSNGRVTEVSAQELREGMPIIVGQTTRGAAP